MNEDQISAVIVGFVREVDGVADPVAPAAHFDAIGVDSMSTMDLLARVEKEFGVAIPDDHVVGIRSVADLAGFVAAARQGVSR